MGSEQVSYDYDGNGNLIHDGQFDYVYDAENQLIEAYRVVSVGVTSLVGSYEYDALGRRSEKKAYSTGEITTRYHYSNDTVLAEYNDLNILQRPYI